MTSEPVQDAASVVHYKDCSRYNWHDPEAQCDGARCRPDPARAENRELRTAWARPLIARWVRKHDRDHHGE
jgi:hypothetical protein